MKLFIVNFYDSNESGNHDHHEIYTTYRAANRRFEYLKKHLSYYSWCYLMDTYSQFGRVKMNRCIQKCDSCFGEDDYYHGDDCDF